VEPNFFKLDDFGMDKIGISKTRLDLRDLGLGKNIEKIKFHDALYNFVCTKPKSLV